jgi:HEPN domain-containing protein
MSFKDPVTETVCFHCQQAVEKYLKAFLIYHQIYFKKTHQISELIELCSTLDPSFRTHLIEADDLSDYAVDVRYPDIGFEPDIKETKLALEISYKVQKFVLSKLNL